MLLLATIFSEGKLTRETPPTRSSGEGLGGPSRAGSPSSLALACRATSLCFSSLGRCCCVSWELPKLGVQANLVFCRAPSEAATLLHDHVFVVLQEHPAIVHIQHAQRLGLHWCAARGRDTVGLVAFQQTL